MDSWLIDAIASSRKRLRASSVEVYASRWRSLCSAVGPLPAEGLTTELLAAGVGRLPSYLAQKRALELCLWVCETRVRAGELDANPAEPLRAQYWDDQRPLLKTEVVSHLGDMLEAAAAGQARGWKLVRLRALGHLAALGLKAGELRSLKISDLDLSKGVVRAGKPARTLKLPSSTVKTLSEWLAARPDGGSNVLLVANPAGAPLDAATIWRQVCRLQAGSGVPVTTGGTSGLRAAVAANLVAKGAQVSEVQEVLGHRDLASTHELLGRLRVGDA